MVTAIVGKKMIVIGAVLALLMAVVPVPSARASDEDPPAETQEGPRPEAQEDTGGESEEDLRAKTQNPVGSLISVPFENNVDFGAPNGTAYVLNFQPVIPVTVGNWNLINRPILPIAYVPGFFGGVPGLPAGSSGGGAFGLGDLNYSVFLSPAEPGKVIWGIGPSMTFPIATNDQLGSQKWSAGPTAVALMQPKPWTIGVLARQLWSFAGKNDRADVNQFLVQPFLNYNFDGGWFLFSDPTITANWGAESGQKWTVPLGGGAGRVFNIGKQPVNMRMGAFGNVVRPDFAPKWALKFTIQLLFPK